MEKQGANITGFACPESCKRIDFFFFQHVPIKETVSGWRVILKYNNFQKTVTISGKYWPRRLAEPFKEFKLTQHGVNGRAC